MEIHKVEMYASSDSLGLFSPNYTCPQNPYSHWLAAYLENHKNKTETLKIVLGCGFFAVETFS